MSVVVVGLNHHTAPISLLERLSIAEERLDKALHQLGTYEHVLEGAILSTCNRVEVYAVVSRFHGGSQDLRNFLAEFCHVAPEDFSDHLYTYHDESAARHLLRVASGVDSLIVGESEILGQVRRAYQVASAECTVGRVLDAAFRRALRAGKKARSETRIGRNPVSISSAAVELARRAFGRGTLDGKRIAIVGAGKMGRLAAQALTRSGARDVVVVNRGEARGLALARDFGAKPRPLEELEEVIAGVDIVISSTTSTQTVIEKDLVRRAVKGRSEPLFIVDIAVPRDVESGVRDLPGVVLRDIDDLRGVVDVNIGERLSEASKVEAIIAEELDRFVEWERATEVAPTVAALVERARGLVDEELTKLEKKLGNVTAEERDLIRQSVQQLVARLLHPAITRTKELGGSKQGYMYVPALRELFELDDDSSP